jgi:hypothetical protein
MHNEKLPFLKDENRAIKRLLHVLSVSPATQSIMCFSFFFVIFVCLFLLEELISQLIDDLTDATIRTHKLV